MKCGCNQMTHCTSINCEFNRTFNDQFYFLANSPKWILQIPVRHFVTSTRPYPTKVLVNRFGFATSCSNLIDFASKKTISSN